MTSSSPWPEMCTLFDRFKKDFVQNLWMASPKILRFFMNDPILSGKQKCIENTENFSKWPSILQCTYENIVTFHCSCKRKKIFFLNNWNLFSVRKQFRSTCTIMQKIYQESFFKESPQNLLLFTCFHRRTYKRHNSRALRNTAVNL